MGALLSPAETPRRAARDSPAIVRQAPWHGQDGRAWARKKTKGVRAVYPDASSALGTLWCYCAAVFLLWCSLARSWLTSRRSPQRSRFPARNARDPTGHWEPSECCNDLPSTHFVLP